MSSSLFPVFYAGLRPTFIILIRPLMDPMIRLVVFVSGNLVEAARLPGTERSVLARPSDWWLLSLYNEDNTAQSYLVSGPSDIYLIYLMDPSETITK